MEQLSWKQGLKLFKEKGEGAITKELQQVHDMEGLKTRQWSELNKDQQAKALKYLMYLKEKRCGEIKARGCVDGGKQRIYTDKQEAQSPTVSLAALMLSCVIDAVKEHDIVTVNIPGAFLQTEMPEDDKDVHVMLEG